MEIDRWCSPTMNRIELSIKSMNFRKSRHVLTRAPICRSDTGNWSGTDTRGISTGIQYSIGILATVDGLGFWHLSLLGALTIQYNTVQYFTK